MRISLNLATRPFVDIRPVIKRLRIAMAVLLVIGLGLCLGLHAFHQKAEDARADQERVQHQIDAINRERQGYDALMHQPANVQLLAQIGELNKLFDEKTFSWTLGMEDLETVLPAGVQVTSIEPIRDKKSGIITLKLRVVGPRDRAVDLVQNLERSKHFLRPAIVGENAESTGGPNERLEPISASNRVNFDVQAEYNPAAPVDLNLRAERKQEEEKPMAAGPLAGKSEPPAHPAHPAAPQAARPSVPQMMRPPAPPAASGQQPDRMPYTGPVHNRPVQNPNLRHKPNPGVPQ
jgi:type IV pilus assembly protein PilN